MLELTDGRPRPPLTPRTFDPQGHRMGPVGTLACQASIVLGLIWTFGALALFFLPTSVGLLSLAPVLGALFLAPRSLVMQYPVSLSLLAVWTMATVSIMWTVDTFASSVVIRGLMPAILAVILAAGLIPLRDVGTAVVWAVRLVIVITIVALALYPETRLHLTNDPYVDNYPGWHGFFTHKNKLAPFLVFGMVSVMVFDRSWLTKLPTFGLIGALFVGSESATGLSAAALIVVVYVWLRVYQSQEDLRTSTVFAAMSLAGLVVLAIGVLSSIATITSAYGKETTFSGRTYIWEASIDAIGERPFFGYGLGALFYTERVSPETAALWRQVGFRASHAHNGAIDLTLQIGFVGLALFLVVWITTFARGWRALRTEPELGIWVVSVLFTQMFMSLSEDVYFGGWMAVLGMMTVLVLRRRASLHAPPISAMSRWAAPG